MTYLAGTSVKGKAELIETIMKHLTLAVVLIASTVTVAEARNPTRCSDYSTWEEAQAALKRGEYWLDRDNDGIACESLRH